MDKIFIFFIFLGPLIFFHELGHFLMARLFGVRVEVFSIGFGPKLFSFKKGDTQYAFSLIPLGGYVKMFGDDMLSDKVLTAEEQSVAFTYKSKWARFWIVFGGPLANFILAFVLYFGLVLVGETVPQPRFGEVKATHPYHDLGFRSGDALKKINDDKILSFDDLNMIDTNVERVVVEREGKEVTISLNKKNIEFLKDFQELQTRLRAPLLMTEKGEQWVISDRPDTFNLERSLESFAGNSTGEELYLYKVLSQTKDEQILKEHVEAKSTQKIQIKGDFYASLAKSNFYPIDLMVESIVMKSAADTAKIKSGDIIFRVNGHNLTGFEDIRAEVQRYDGKNPLKIDLLRDGNKMEFELTPNLTEVRDQKVYTIGIYSAAKVLPIEMIDTESRGLIGSLLLGFTRTTDGIVKTIEGFKRLIIGDVSIGNLGGPIAIGKVAADSFYISVSMFLRLMALISINLGIINLFPIPVLDGGHIVFILLEAINRGPLSRKKMEIAQQFGLSLLFILIFIALFNDFYKMFS